MKRSALQSTKTVALDGKSYLAKEAPPEQKFAACRLIQHKISSGIQERINNRALDPSEFLLLAPSAPSLPPHAPYFATRTSGRKQKALLFSSRHEKGQKAEAKGRGNASHPHPNPAICSAIINHSDPRASCPGAEPNRSAQLV